MRDDGALATADNESNTPEMIQERLKSVIKVAVADAGVLRKRVTVTVPRSDVDAELEKEYKELVTEAIIPGFRRGRAPRRLVEKRFGTEVGQQVQTRIVSNAYLAAIDKEGLKVLGDPLLWVKLKDKAESDSEQLVDMPTAIGHLKLPEEGDFEFKCEVEVKPEFELPSLDGVPVERPVLEITDEDVDVQIKRARANRGHWAPVLDGSVERDDMLICDMVMTADGKEIKKAENIQLAARPQRIEGVTFEDFGDRFNGARVGATKTLEGELPDDYEVEDLRGKKARIELKLNDIKRLELPPMDKEYLESQGFESEKELREYVRDEMKNRLDSEIKRGMRNQVRKYLLDHTKLDLPEGLSSRQTERAVLRKAIDLQRQGVPISEIAKHADELRTIAQEETTTELKLHFVLEEIAEKLEIEVSEEEINAAIMMMAQAYNRRFDRMRDDLARNNGLEMLYLQIRDEKCIDKILEKAKVTDAEMPRKPAAKGEKAASAGEAQKPSAKAVAAEKPAKAQEPKAEKKPAEKKESKPAAPKGGAGKKSK
ncbi:MAG: trigger factor [Planctomycetota bacterium]|nr:MAG: trigger factor [Planctomycetota bacterium]